MFKFIMYKTYNYTNTIVERSVFMETLQKTALVFTIIGALNWLLIGLFDFNLVTTLFQEGSFLTRLVYIIVGICGLFNIMILFKHLKFD